MENGDNMSFEKQQQQRTNVNTVKCAIVEALSKLPEDITEEEVLLALVSEQKALIERMMLKIAEAK